MGFRSQGKNNNRTAVYTVSSAVDAARDSPDMVTDAYASGLLLPEQLLLPLLYLLDFVTRKDELPSKQLRVGLVSVFFYVA